MKKIYTSLEIGNDTIRILVSEYFQGKRRTLAVSAVRSKGIKNGIITDEASLQERIKMAIEDINSRINMPIKKVLLVVPSLNAEFNLAHGNIPIINDEKIVTRKDITRVQNSIIKDIVPNMELVSITPIDFSIYENGSLIETIKNPKDKICDRLGVRAIVVTVPKQLIISYAKIVEESGLEVVDLAFAPESDFEEIKNEELKEETTALINIGKDITTVSVFNKGIITNSTSINIGSKIIDKDISYIYYLSMKSARKVKENFGCATTIVSSKSETYEAKDINEKIISINQFEVSEIINKRIVQILNLAKNELKVLTNKQIRYIMVVGGITDMLGFGSALEEVLGKNAKIYTENKLGIRKARFITASGAIKYFIRKIKLRGKEYSMFSSEEVDSLVHNKTRIGRSDSMFGRFVSYFFDN